MFLIRRALYRSRYRVESNKKEHGRAIWRLQERAVMSLQTSPASLVTEEDKIISEICNYAERHETKQMLQEYMRRLILEKPSEPLKFLIAQITENPYVPAAKDTEGGAAAEAK